MSSNKRPSLLLHTDERNLDAPNDPPDSDQHEGPELKLNGEKKLEKNEEACAIVSSIMQKEMTDTIEKYGEPTFKSNLICYYGTEKVLEKMHFVEAMKIGPKIFVTDNLIQYSEKVQQMIGYVRYEIKSRASKGKVVTTLLPSIGICTKKIGRRQAVSIQSYPPSSVRIPEVAIKASDEFTDECKAPRGSPNKFRSIFIIQGISNF